MKSLSFLLPVRIDNQDRWSNLVTCLRFLGTTFPGSEILLVENAGVQKCKSLEKDFKLKHIFIKNPGNFSRSTTINHGLEVCSGKYFAVWDIDVLVWKWQIEKAVSCLETGNIHIVLPHNSIFVNVKSGLKERLSDSLDLSLIPQIGRISSGIKSEQLDIYPIPSGVVIFNTQSLKNIGGFNETMKSYGWEDIEILKRSQKLGMYYFSLPKGNIIHLDHARGTDSRVNKFYEKNKEIFLKVVSLKKKELIGYINKNLLRGGKQVDTFMLRRIARRNLIFCILPRFVVNRVFNKLRISGLWVARFFPF
jgi:predicted glycosyltransferase involved in capsule biosynthesis